MRLGLIDYNKGQMPGGIREALEICSIYSRKEIEQWLQKNYKGIHKINNGTYVFGFCEKEFEKELQEEINKK